MEIEKYVGIDLDTGKYAHQFWVDRYMQQQIFSIINDNQNFF